MDPAEVSAPVRIPADIDRPDRLVAGMTARQIAIIAATATAVYLLWGLLLPVVPLAVLVMLTVPLTAVAVVVAVGSRDGLSLDRYVWAAIRHRSRPRRQVLAPEGIPAVPAFLSTVDASAGRGEAAVPLQVPVRDIDGDGVVDLAADGIVMVAACSMVNFALRTPTEHDALVACFARFLHSMTAPVQILVRTVPLDLTSAVAALREHAPALPHPALEAAALAHAAHLQDIREQTQLLRRQVLLVVRESSTAPTASMSTSGLFRFRVNAVESAATREAAVGRLRQRLTEAASLLAPAGITVAALDGAESAAILAGAFGLKPPPAASAGLAAPGAVITTPATESLTQAGAAEAAANQVPSGGVGMGEDGKERWSA